VACSRPAGEAQRWAGGKMFDPGYYSDADLKNAGFRKLGKNEEELWCQMEELWCQILNCELHSSLFTIQDLTPIFQFPPPTDGGSSRCPLGSTHCHE
jgi:hypothetical protein